MRVLTPADEAEACAIIADATSTRRPLRLEGGGTRAGLGRPVVADTVLSSRGLQGITLHEPAELVVSARAGTPLSVLEATLAQAGQQLAFEPGDLRTLYDTAGEPTVGGLVATNWSGPRRIMVGAVRDHLIGLRFVNGRGELVKSGGRVMKNVTGLDLAKLQCGAHGTLGFLMEATFKVLPRTETCTTLVLHGLDDNRAVQALAAALGSPFEVSGAAHLPASPGREGARTLMRLENFADSIAYRFDRLADLLKPYGAADRLGPEDTRELWQQVRDGTALGAPAEAAVWRLSVAPTRAPSAVALLSRTIEARHFYDWGGGLVWLATAPDGDAGAGAIREALKVTGGQATLIRAPDALRARLDVFQPLDAALASLSAGLKASFDPAAILNPGRMYPPGTP